jgi:hypothetical protein
MDDNANVDSHESYGSIALFQCSASRSGKDSEGKQTISGARLFGSPIRHSSFIGLRICRAEMHRSHHSERLHPAQQLIEIHISPTQFGEMLTSIGAASGVPCTIRAINRNLVPPPPQRPTDKEKIHVEFEETMLELAQGLDAKISEVKMLLSNKKALNQQERQAVLGHLETLRQQIKENIPFIHECFEETVEKTVAVAKAEINSHCRTMSLPADAPERILIGVTDEN